MISQFDSYGKLIVSKTFGTAGYDEGYSAIKTADGGIAIIGTLNNQMGLLKFNANLTLQWAKQITVTNAGSYGTSLVQTADGGYLTTGVLYHNSNNSSAGYLVKLDSMGKVLFSKQYFDFASNGIQDIAATKDGNYALWGAVQDANENFADTTYLLK